MTNNPSVVFTWSPDDFEGLLASCETDGVFDLVKKYVPQEASILESGCGLGRYVRYLQDRGWSIIGLEYSNATIEQVKKVWPDLDIREGDASNSPFQENEFDVVLSLGVVEHFPLGLGAPLKDIHRVLKSGGIAVITIPCLNRIRQFKYSLWCYEFFGLPRAILVALFRGRNMRLTRLESRFKYAVYPAYGDFFEYRLTPNQFLTEIEAAGFMVLEHKPHAIIDGLYHDINPIELFVRFHKGKFKVSLVGNWLNSFLSSSPFFHCHMQVVVVKKP